MADKKSETSTGKAASGAPVVPGTPLKPPANGQEKPAESKADKFLRLAVPRVNKAIDRIKHIRALANRSQYEYTELQWEKIWGALVDELNATKRAFEGKKEAKQSFTL